MITDEDAILLRRFEGDFPSEEACASFIRELLLQEKLLNCHRCNSSEVQKLKERTVRCLECGDETWFTAGTIFERTRKLKPFLALLWFEGQGRSISSSRARDLLGIAQSSAWVMAKKIELVLLSDLQQDTENAALLPCDIFRAAINKRSRETPAREHPEAEIQSFVHLAERIAELDSSVERQHDGERPPSSTQAFSASTTDVPLHLPDAQQRVLDVLTDAKASLHIDRLSQLTEIPMNDLFLQLVDLELEKLIVAQAGNRYTINRSQGQSLIAQSAAQGSAQMEEVQQAVTAFIAFCCSNFHGTSRKYLQLYLSHFSRATRKTQANWNIVVRKLLRHPPIHHIEIVSYVSPMDVNILRQAA